MQYKFLNQSMTEEHSSLNLTISRKMKSLITSWVHLHAPSTDPTADDSLAADPGYCVMHPVGWQVGQPLLNSFYSYAHLEITSPCSDELNNCLVKIRYLL